MDELEVLHHRTIATSAVRESRNGQELVALVRRKTGLEIDLISGAEEARLVFLAARQKVPLGNERWIIVDLGGGSVEVSLVEEQGLLWTESHAIGSVRLLEELGRAGQEPGRLRDLLVEYVGTLGVRLAADRERISGVIATGGNIETIAKLAFPASEDNEIIRLPLARLRAIIERLSLLSYEQRIQELGLREDRADVILPAALVYERLCVLAGAEEMIVPFVGLKEGIVIDLMDELVSHRAHTDRQEREALAAAAALGRRYSFNESHGMHVARLAGSLFDQLAPLHGLGDAERRLLLAAAVLHDVGQYVSFQKHHKHTLYLISESDLPGFSSTEMRIMGNVARYHRRSEPSTRHEPFTRLKPAERRIVRKLGSILRLADALDSEKQQRVQRVEARMTDKKLSLRLEGSGELLLERWAVQKKRDFFTRVFGLEVELEA
jgi:exopolyphosphatase/guanosine-5'-triphosphate,3'-diphosphate pyrophosphatase